MKKLKASEITEPGWYWVYEGKYKAPSDVIYFYPIDLPAEKQDYQNPTFIKAEPPKVCRWKFAGSLDMPFYALSCKDIFANIEMGKSFTYCPYCSGHIETEE